MFSHYRYSGFSFPPWKNISVRKDHIKCILYTVSKINSAKYTTIYSIERDQEQFYDTAGGKRGT